jgi:hypothetical protein
MNRNLPRRLPVVLGLLRVAQAIFPAFAHARQYHFTRVLHRGDQGDDVRALNVRVAGWYPGSRTQSRFRISKHYWAKTEQAVEAFQSFYGLTVDGVAGPEVFAVLDKLGDRDGSTAHFDYSEFVQNRNPACSAKANAYAGTFSGGMVASRKAKRNARHLMWRLEAVRAKGRSNSIGINSGFRSVAYNKCIGGAGLSQHLYGNAADNRMAKIDNRKERLIAERSDFSGVACYSAATHNHFDLRLENAALDSSRFWWWPDRNKKGQDLDENGRPCWGQSSLATASSPTNAVALRTTPAILTMVRDGSATAGSLIPTAAEVQAFEAAGETGRGD